MAKVIKKKWMPYYWPIPLAEEEIPMDKGGFRSVVIDMEKVISEFEDFVKSFSKRDDTYYKGLFVSVLALLKEHGWIPITERLPRSLANKVLVYVQHEDYVGYIGYGHYEKYKGQEMWFDLEHDEEFSKRGYHVTHWMETPMPPMEGR